MTGGASAPHPSSSTGSSFLVFRSLDARPPPVPLDCVGVKAGFDATGGLVLVATGGGALPAEYLEPEESATFCIIPSGVKSRSDRAVI